MQFLSDNAASVHPRVWDAMRAADAPDAPYDNDALSRMLDERFSDLFARPAHVVWAATGTAANCLALATMVPPHGGVICHREAHIETDECGAPGFYTHEQRQHVPQVTIEAGLGADEREDRESWRKQHELVTPASRIIAVADERDREGQHHQDPSAERLLDQ